MRPIAVRLPKASAVPPTALRTIPLWPRVQIIARLGLVRALRPTPVTVALIRPHRETRRTAIAAIRHNLAPIRRQHLAVPTPRPIAPTQLLAAAMAAEAAALLTAQAVALPTAVAARHMVVGEAVPTVIDRISASEEGPARYQRGGPISFFVSPEDRKASPQLSLRSRV
jgi:hypothetical protein